MLCLWTPWLEPEDLLQPKESTAAVRLALQTDTLHTRASQGHAKLTDLGGSKVRVNSLRRSVIYTTPPSKQERWGVGPTLGKMSRGKSCFYLWCAGITPTKKNSTNAMYGQIKFSHVGSHEFRESLRELFRKFWSTHCTSREMPL